jgi:hypothetical protein
VAWHSLLQLASTLLLQKLSTRFGWIILSAVLKIVWIVLAAMSSSEEGATMEGRAPRRRRGSPSQSGVPVTVVYYLCRSGRHLEHPHLMEMRLASPNQALYLRDVIRRLDALRGKGMAAMYSWSCKR